MLGCLILSTCIQLPRCKLPRQHNTLLKKNLHPLGYSITSWRNFPFPNITAFSSKSFWPLVKNPVSIYLLFSCHIHVHCILNAWCQSTCIRGYVFLETKVASEWLHTWQVSTGKASHTIHDQTFHSIPQTSNSMTYFYYMIHTDLMCLLKDEY